MLLAGLAAAMFGRGGRGYFSPDTLDFRTHAEWVVPLVDIPIWRGPSSTHRYPVVDYLVAEGLWSPSGASDPAWLPIFQWNAQWWDGDSQFHCELGGRGEIWVRWSKDNPAMAKALWPRVLRALRRPGTTSTADASHLMAAARSARTVEQLEKIADDLAATRPRG